MVLGQVFQIGKLIFRTSYGKGFRSPSLKELYFNFVDINHNIIGNTNLLAEYSNNFTANLQWKNDTKFGNIKIKTAIKAIAGTICSRPII